MPLPTMHLWVARKVAEQAGFELSGRYLLGNISPDAVKVKKKVDPKDYPYAHLRNESFQDGWDNAVRLLNSKDTDAFMKGYAIHIMLDHLWALGPYTKLKNAVTKKYSEEDFKRFYQRDCEFIERWLYRQSDSRSLWTAVMNAPITGFGDHISPGEVDLYRKDSYTSLNDGKEMKPVGMISLTVARAFMDNAAEKIVQTIKR